MSRVAAKPGDLFSVRSRRPCRCPHRQPPLCPPLAALLAQLHICTLPASSLPSSPDASLPSPGASLPTPLAACLHWLWSRR
ncbi:hypothetical protein DAI22_03g083400 [Oryza sativa Japonica Group]|nr:hypothetical protein DAI22_03g083400 [Oryza sativa Japonica Group]